MTTTYDELSRRVSNQEIRILNYLIDPFGREHLECCPPVPVKTYFVRFSGSLLNIKSIYSCAKHVNICLHRYIPFNLIFNLISKPDATSSSSSKLTTSTFNMVDNINTPNHLLGQGFDTPNPGIP